ncbi:D-Ala-D-Ala carboxypeptidase family metallohydrolase [Microbulbifer hainanensis]|uniref:D-Ala-D-Ala carboxypeptidase family metallohydrolase n=1 Tax=Microbulbifer hainanensis TaxID=2735675 RepID=UPI001868A19C|nr:D-Ala-D-Ala carboxypeptidase family metallohydrolase [Microbulbifer hainanensis]
MDIKETEDHEFVDIHIERRRFVWITLLVLAGTIVLVVLTVDKVRELAERIVTPVEYRPIPEVYDIKGYAAASQSAFEKFLQKGDNRENFAKLENYLQQNKVDQVVPLYELLRQGSDWQEVGEPPFAIPPPKYWPSMVATLRVLQKEIIPRIGPVTVLSGWRTTKYNAKAGGAKTSKHMHFCGLDMIPQRNYTRKQLVPKLRKIHNKVGKKWDVGLGIYSGIRFHVDTCGYRRW